MKFSGQERHGPVIIKFLRDHGPHTVREVATAIHVEVPICNKALRRMMARGFVSPTGEYRGDGNHRAQLYQYMDVEDLEDMDQVMSQYERNRAIAASEWIVRSLRSGYNPAMFDPFRVLRAQVGA